MANSLHQVGKNPDARFALQIYHHLAEPPANWPATQCHLCLEHFLAAVNCRKHCCSCPRMPYKMWLSRIRRTQQEVTVSDHPCYICGIKFWTAHATGRHSVVCKQRRDAEHKLINLEQPSLLLEVPAQTVTCTVSHRNSTCPTLKPQPAKRFLMTLEYLNRLKCDAALTGRKLPRVPRVSLMLWFETC